MDLTIPFSKDILFKSKIAEICSISLEEDVSINEKELLGDFIVSGEYKNLDVNVDTMPFNHIVPFSVELDDDILFESLKYEIVDFSYDVVDDEILRVNISFHVEALKDESKRVNNVFEKVVVDDKNFNDVILEDSVINEKNDVDEEKIDPKNDLEKMSVFNANDLKEDYITYHVHMVKIGETIESISSDFKVAKEDIMDLNDITGISVGDKLIIPVLTDDK